MSQFLLKGVLVIHVRVNVTILTKRGFWLYTVFELQYNSGVLRCPETRKRRHFSSERHPINKVCGQLLSLITTKFNGVATMCSQMAGRNVLARLKTR